MRRWFAGAMMCGALVAATLLACGDASDENPSRPRTNTPPASGTPFGDAGDGINSSGAGAGSGAVTGLPCDVQQLFEQPNLRERSDSQEVDKRVATLVAEQ